MVNSTTNIDPSVLVFIQKVAQYIESSENDKQQEQIATVSRHNDIMNHLANHDKHIGEIYKMLATQNTDIDYCKDEITNIKENDRIDGLQKQQIKTKAFQRISTFIHPGTVDYQKYRFGYFGSLYTYLRQYCYYLGMESSKKKNYDDIMAGIDSWYPDERKIRERADNAAIARVIAKEEGYSN